MAILSEEAKNYAATLFKRASTELEKQRETRRKEAWHELINRVDAEKKYGYEAVTEPDVTLIEQRAGILAQSLEQAYRWQSLPIDEEAIGEIKHRVGGEIEGGSTMLLAREAEELKLRQQRTNSLDQHAEEGFKELSLRLLRLRKEKLEKIDSDLRIKLFEERKSKGEPQKTRIVSAEYLFHPEIEPVSRKLYNEGNFRNAVLDAFIYVIDRVKQVSGLDRDGDDLMNKAFGCEKQEPVLQFNALADDSDRDEQRGILFLFKGIVQMRNFKAHKISSFDDPNRAFEYLSLASLLMRLLDLAHVKKPNESKA